MKNDKAKKIRLFFVLLSAALFFLTPGLTAGFSEDKAVQTTSNVKQEVVKLRYVEAQTVERLLYPYWGPQTKISQERKGKVLIISDTPENLARILEAIKKIDVKPVDLVFTIQLIVASESEGSTDPELKDDPLIKELQKLLLFKNYQLLDATMVRAIDGQRSGITFGPNNQFTISLDPEVSEDSPQGHIKLRVFFSQVRAEQLQTVENTIRRYWVQINPVVLVDSHLNLKSGDRAVVGVSRLKEEGQTQGNNKGIIMIISGKIAS